MSSFFDFSGMVDWLAFSVKPASSSVPLLVAMSFDYFSLPSCFAKLSSLFF